MEIFLTVLGTTFVVETALSIYYVVKDVIPHGKLDKAHQEQEKLRIAAGKSREEWYGTINNSSERPE